MREREPMTQTMNTSDAGRAFEQIVKKVSQQKTRVVVQEGGAPVAAIVSPKDLARLAQLDKQRTDDFGILEASLAAFADTPEEEIEAAITRAIAEVRAEARDQADTRTA